MSRSSITVGSHQHTVLAWLALGDRVATNIEIADATRMDSQAVATALAKLHARGRVVRYQGKRRGDMRSAITPAGRAALADAKAPEIPPPPKSETRRKLPVVQASLVPGSGIRREECASYAACLEAHARAYSQDGHCPLSCRWYEAAPEVHPHAFASSGRSNYEAAIFTAGRG